MDLGGTSPELEPDADLPAVLLDLICPGILEAVRSCTSTG